MKTLYLVRHAKSSWKDASLRDKDRPLNKRGKRDAPRMAEYLSQQIVRPDLFVSSPSTRTQDTAVSFLHAFGRLKKDLVLEEQLFHGSMGEIIGVVQALDDSCDSAMLFVHNPGITSAVNRMADQHIFNIPTCGAAGMSFDIDHWSDLKPGHAKMLFYFYPKGLDLQFKSS